MSILLILIAGYFLFPPVCFSKQKNQKDIDIGVVTAEARTITTRLSAYGRVEPITTLKLNAEQGGIVSGLTVLPGEMVKAGVVLGHMTGPTVDGLLAQCRNSVAVAGVAVTMGEKTLAIERQKQAVRLATRKAVYQAEARLVRAQDDLNNALSQLQAVRKSLVLKTPSGGILLAVYVHKGEWVQAGQTILTLQPTGGLWLMAHYYGPDAAAIRVGMTGQFESTGGGSAIPVRVRTVIGQIGSDGGESIGLIATVPAPCWLNGDVGRVILSGGKETYVTVPTRALVLDRGRWWVLEHTEHGNQRREVVPGPSQGTMTLIKQGLEAGSQVLVENAYLEFHRDFSRQYQKSE